MNEDVDLLRRYVEESSEVAFAELVRRRIGLVYAIAWRRTHDAHSAQDVTQEVFTALARKAPQLIGHQTLVGWLYRSAHFAASDAVRAIRRQQRREQEALAMQQIDDQNSEPDWRQLSPVVDEVLSEMPEADRDAVLLRVVDVRSYVEIGRDLRISESGARMRVERALEKMRQGLARRGITSTAAALTLAIGQQATAAVPAAVTSTVAATAVSKAASVGGVAAVLSFMSKTKMAMTALGFVAIAGVISSVFQWRIAQRAESALALVATERDHLRARLAAKGSANQVTSPMPTATARVATKLSLAEIESKLAEIIREGLWRDGVAVRELVPQIETKHLQAVLGFIERTATGIARRNLLLELTEYWARLDPAAAAAWCGQLPPGPDRQHLSRLVANLWAETDPEAALRLAGPAPEVFRRLAQRSPNEAASQAIQLPVGDDRASAIRTIAQTWFEKDPKQAMNWIAGLQALSDRTAGLSAVMHELEPSELSGMASYVTNLVAHSGASEFARDFAATWANGDARAAAMWARTLPESSPARERAIGAIAEIWTRDDPRATAAWIAELPPSNTRDVATRVLADNLASYDPASALGFVSQLASESSRGSMIIRIAQSWLKSDPNAAQRWLADANLPEEQRRTLLNERPAPNK